MSNSFVWFGSWEWMLKFLAGMWKIFSLEKRRKSAKLVTMTVVCYMLLISWSLIPMHIHGFPNLLDTRKVPTNKAVNKCIYHICSTVNETVSRVFCFRFFLWISFPPVTENNIRVKFFTGVNDTSCKEWEQYQTDYTLKWTWGKFLIYCIC
jgi:hypothetical protein